MIIMFPIPSLMSNRMRLCQVELMAKMDARVQMVSESTAQLLLCRDQLANSYFTVVLGVSRMVKLFGWETRATERISERRDKELSALDRLRFMNLVTTLAAWVHFGTSELAF